MKTNTSFIHEYDILDDFTDCVVESVGTLEECTNEYNSLVREYELKSFFEGSQKEAPVAVKKEGIFTRIGNTIINLIKGIGKILTAFIEKFTKKNKEIETDEVIVNRLCSQHPEIRQQVIEGIEKDWFTYHNVAAYKNDIVGLCMMLKQKKIDNKTFREKCGEKFRSFIEKGRTLLVAGATVAGIMTLIPRMRTAYKECKETMNGVKKNLEKQQQSLNKHSKTSVKTEAVTDHIPDVEIIQLIVSELSKVSAVIAKEMKAITSGQNKISSVFKGVIAKYAK